MLVVACWLWSGRYHTRHVNRLYEAVKRNLDIPFRFVCLTDQPANTGIDPAIDCYSLPCDRGLRNGRRMWIFSDDARVLFKLPTHYAHILQIDIDCVITGNITSLVALARHESPFYIWKCPMNTRFRYGLNPSFMLLEAGAWDHVWRDYISQPDRRINIANRAGWPASDQAIISQTFSDVHSLTEASPTVPVWTQDDGIYAFQEDLNLGLTPLPDNARLVSFHGRYDPDQYHHLEWVKKYWLSLA